MSGRQSSQVFAFAMTSASALPGGGHHGTLTTWSCNIIDSEFIYGLHPNMICAIPNTTYSFYNTVDKTSLTELHDFIETNAAVDDSYHLSQTVNFV
jgi:hypothetical protein